MKHIAVGVRQSERKGKFGKREQRIKRCMGKGKEVGEEERGDTAEE